MIITHNKFSDIERLIMMLDGSSFALHEANRDKDNYEKYKKGEIDTLSKDYLKEIEILQLLERLGYPMDKLGTYLFKDLIVEVYNSIQDVSGKKDLDKCRDVLIELTDPYSNFYHYIAREWKEIGVKPFHLHIKRAIENIDSSNIDSKLSKDIYKDNYKENNYGLHAFQIASYILDKDNKIEYKQPKIKELKPNNE